MPEQEGIKYDQGKRRLGEMIVDFKEPLEALCAVWEFGADKYAKSNWKYVENGKDRYTNAMIRHMVAEDEVLDPESGLLHATHVAWNALARLHFILKELDSQEWKDKVNNIYKKRSTEPIQLKLPFDDVSVTKSDTVYTYGTRCK